MQRYWAKIRYSPVDLGIGETRIDLFVELVDDLDWRFLGAPTPIQPITSKPGMKSAMVGISGNASTRDVAVTASPRSVPALMYPIDAGMGLK